MDKLEAAKLQVAYAARRKAYRDAWFKAEAEWANVPSPKPQNVQKPPPSSKPTDPVQGPIAADTNN